MKFTYATDRLTLRVLDPREARNVLAFEKKNQDFFLPYETDHVPNYLSLEYQKTLMTAEYNATLRGSMVRFWIFLRSRPQQIIGTVSFQGIVRFPEQCCRTGYRIDQDFAQQGYMTEALRKGQQIMFEEEKLHRIVARIHPYNSPSRRLVQRLGYTLEGLERRSVLLHGTWQDMERWVLFNPSG